MIGWYAHHHGRGHLARAQAVRPHLPGPVTTFSSRPAEGVVPLPLDVDPPRSPACASAAEPTAWHYAPLGVDGVRRRMGLMTAWVVEHDPAAFVVDVSVEVAGLMRLLGIPTVVVRQHGRRDDLPHELAYRDAQVLLAPWPRALEGDRTPDWVVERTSYTGGFSRHDGRPADRAASRRRLGVAAEEQVVVTLGGAGGHDAWPIAATAAATPGWRWAVLGRHLHLPPGFGPGWVDDPWDWLCAADVIVTHGGHNAVMECAAAGTPTIVIPQDRPFDEQRDKCRALAREGLGTVLSTWPDPDGWDDLLTRTAAGGSTLAPISDGGGALVAAQVISDLARRMGGTDSGIGDPGVAEPA
ncbi:glycosyltransferase [Euzebya sp.]|uniref:glycosyltransferase n=1 Tax=Euzebya sp. TaxID=1971409 RepID=UPI00351546C1